MKNFKFYASLFSLMLLGTVAEASTYSHSKRGEIKCPTAEPPMPRLPSGARPEQFEQWRIQKMHWSQRERDRLICEENKKNQETGGAATLTPLTPEPKKDKPVLSGASS